MPFMISSNASLALIDKMIDPFIVVVAAPVGDSHSERGTCRKEQRPKRRYKIASKMKALVLIFKDLFVRPAQTKGHASRDPEERRAPFRLPIVHLRRPKFSERSDWKCIQGLDSGPDIGLTPGLRSGRNRPGGSSGSAMLVSKGLLLMQWPDSETSATVFGR
jgi:hypothetical protein